MPAKLIVDSVLPFFTAWEPTCGRVIENYCMISLSVQWSGVVAEQKAVEQGFVRMVLDSPAVKG